MDKQQVNNLLVFCHASSLAGFVFPFGNILGPVILWSMKKNEVPAVDEQGKEVINFQISFTIYFFVAMILTFVLIGIPLIFVLIIIMLVQTIKGIIAANEGKVYKYPFSIRFIK